MAAFKTCASLPCLLSPVLIILMVGMMFLQSSKPLPPEIWTSNFANTNLKTKTPLVHSLGGRYARPGETPTRSSRSGPFQGFHATPSGVGAIESDPSSASGTMTVHAGGQLHQIPLIALSVVSAVVGTLVAIWTSARRPETALASAGMSIPLQPNRAEDPVVPPPVRRISRVGPSGYSNATTARRIAKDFASNIKGKVAVVTGCNTGIGKETVLQLCTQGARVVMACRDEVKMHQAAEDIRRRVPTAIIYELKCDLGSQRSIREFVQEFAALNLPCDLLINNAGVMACPREITEDGYEKQFGVNHLGHFTLTNLMLPFLKAAMPSRVVIVSSEAHSLAYVPAGIRLDDLTGATGYTEWGAYGQSKLANILHAQELNRKFAGLGLDIKAYSVHPGVIGTDLYRYQNPIFLPLVMLGLGLFGKSVEQGAATTLYCAAAPNLPTGYYNNCNEGRLSHPSFLLDSELSSKLWSASVKLTGTDLLPDNSPVAATAVSEAV